MRHLRHPFRLATQLGRARACGLALGLLLGSAIVCGPAHAQAVEDEQARLVACLRSVEDAATAVVRCVGTLSSACRPRSEAGSNAWACDLREAAVWDRLGREAYAAIEVVMDRKERRILRMAQVDAERSRKSACELVAAAGPRPEAEAGACHLRHAAARALELRVLLVRRSETRL